MTVAAVELAAASLRYGSIPALVDVTLDIDEGRKVALIGRSGSGKSSLLAAIVGRVELTGGAVRLFDHDVAGLRGRTGRAIRRRVGFVSQSLDMALPLRVVHNVNAGRLGHQSSAAALWSLLRPGAAPAARDALVKVGLADRLFARTDELSGGEQQRVAIARVLVQQPDLVLADEPTSSVDPRLADDMMALLCAGGHTLVVSVHDPALARRHVDRIIGLRAGEIVLDRDASTVSDEELAGFYDS